MNRIDKIKTLIDNKEEMRKCEESPVYFYNKYIRQKGGRKFSEEEYAEWQKQVKIIMNGAPPLKLRSRHIDLPLDYVDFSKIGLIVGDRVKTFGINDRPLLPKDCYKQPTKQKIK